MAGRKPQLNVTLDDRDRWLLDVVAAARGVSVAALVREQVEAYLRAQEAIPAVGRLIQAAEQLRQEENNGRGTVTEFRPRR